MEGMEYCASADPFHVRGLDPKKKREKIAPPGDFVRCLSVSPYTVQRTFLKKGNMFKSDLLKHFEVNNNRHNSSSTPRAISLPLKSRDQAEIWYNPNDVHSEFNHFSNAFELPVSARGRIVIAIKGRGSDYRNFTIEDEREIKAMLAKTTGLSTKKLEEIITSKEFKEHSKSSRVFHTWMAAN